MPSFSADGDRQFVSIVTGPSHVRLGLKFAMVPVDTVAIVRQPAVGDCDHGELDEAEIISAVKFGVSEVSNALKVAEIIYVANDSPRYSLYAYCAKLLAQRAVGG